VYVKHKIIKRKKGKVKVGIANLSNFLSNSPTQTKCFPSVCLVPGLDFSAIPVSISTVSLVSSIPSEGFYNTVFYCFEFKALVHLTSLT
jgi:hypothetical protein